MLYNSYISSFSINILFAIYLLQRNVSHMNVLIFSNIFVIFLYDTILCIYVYFNVYYRFVYDAALSEFIL